MVFAHNSNILKFLAGGALVTEASPVRYLFYAWIYLDKANRARRKAFVYHARSKSVNDLPNCRCPEKQVFVC